MEPFRTEEHRGLTVELHYDEEPQNPREDCQLGTMFCAHGRYDLGDEPAPTHFDGGAECDSWEDVARVLRSRYPGAVMLPLWLYDHGGITMSTGSFAMDSAGWDSGMVGFIVATPEGIERCGTPPELLEECLRGEVREYAAYLEGNACGYVVSHDGEELESCWGFLDNDDYAMTLGKTEADWWADVLEFHQAALEAALIGPDLSAALSAARALEAA